MPEGVPDAVPLSPREAFEVFQSEIQPTENLEGSSDLGPKPARQHHELSGKNIRVRIGTSDDAHDGRLIKASTTGLVIRCAKPLPFRSTVLAEWSAFGGYELAYAGHVIRTGPEEMAIRLELQSEHDRTFLHSFIELARAESGKALRLSVRGIREGDPVLGQAESTRALEQAWTQLEVRFDSDPAHQEFIQNCLRHQRIDFALARYRDAKHRPAMAAQAAIYLDQLGKILTFSGFQRTREDKRTRVSRRWLSLVAIGVFVLALAAGFRLLGARLDAPPAEIRDLSQAR